MPGRAGCQVPGGGLAWPLGRGPAAVADDAVGGQRGVAGGGAGLLPAVVAQQGEVAPLGPGNLGVGAETGLAGVAAGGAGVR
jgi:hypothetical protein